MSFSLFRDPEPGEVFAALGQRRPVLAIGNFDGVHLGHQALFEAARKAAAQDTAALAAGALTFDPHPARFLNPELAPPLIMPQRRRFELMEDFGLALCVLLAFDRHLASHAPEAFAADILAARLKVAGVVVGPDFRFGRKAAGDVPMLRTLGEAHGFEVIVADPVEVSSITASSTKVREFVHEGRMRGARLLLGRPFELSGPVGRGAGRGSSIGVPTANLEVEQELLPARGVYAAIAQGPAGRHAAAVNIGTVPTFTEGERTTVEAHLLDFEGDLRGQNLRLELVQRIRDERRFPGAEALVAQIREDIAAARELCAPEL